VAEGKKGVGVVVVDGVAREFDEGEVVDIMERLRARDQLRGNDEQ